MLRKLTDKQLEDKVNWIIRIIQSETDWKSLSYHNQTLEKLMNEQVRRDIVREMRTTMTGRELRRLMRRHKVTIRQLAQRMQITMKRVREVRKNGTDDLLSTLDYSEWITGELTPEQRAALALYRNTVLA